MLNKKKSSREVAIADSREDSGKAAWPFGVLEKGRLLSQKGGGDDVRVQGYNDPMFTITDILRQGLPLRTENHRGLLEIGGEN